MTTTTKPQDHARNAQDSAERHVFKEMEKVPKAGHVVHVKGAGTEDDEATYLSIGGLGIRMPKDTNAEVHLVSMGSDTSAKFAIVVIPNDKEHAWAEGQNGLQKWDDPKRRLQWGASYLHLTDEKIAMGGETNAVFEIKGGDVYIRGNLHVSGETFSSGDVHTPTIRSNGAAAPAIPPIPGFTADA